MSGDFDKNKFIQDIVLKPLEQMIQKLGLNNPNVLYGVVESVAGSGYKLNAYVNSASTITPNIPYDPSKTFIAGDKIVILVANRNLRDLFVISKRTV